MKSLIAPAFALALGAATLAGGAASATESVTLDDAAKAKITETLTSQGYEVRRIKTEDGMYEAYALKDGKKMEVYLNAAMEIVRVKTDD